MSEFLCLLGPVQICSHGKLEELKKEKYAHSSQGNYPSGDYIKIVCSISKINSHIFTLRMATYLEYCLSIKSLYRCFHYSEGMLRESIKLNNSASFKRCYSNLELAVIMHNFHIQLHKTF